jgi:hypothetical protein
MFSITDGFQTKYGGKETMHIQYIKILCICLSYKYYDDDDD